MGYLTNIKHLAPFFLYGFGLFCFLRGLTGDGRWALLLAVFLIPLRNVVDKIEYLPLGTQFIDILTAGALIGCFITLSKKNKPMAPSSLNVVILILVIYMFISYLLGNGYLDRPFIYDDRIKDLKNFFLMPLLFFITLNHISDRTWIIRMLMVMVLAFILMDYYSVNQIFAYSSIASRDKITGTFQFLKVNEVAAFYDQYTIILISMFFFLKNKKIKWPLILLIGINVFCILNFFSRGAYLGFLTGIFFLCLFKNRKFLIPLVLIAIFWQHILPEKAVERINQTEDTNGQLDESAQGRIDIWKIALHLFQENPLTGTGFGVFRTLGFNLGDTHNIYIKYLAEQGLIGITIFFIVILCFLRMGYVLFKKGEDDLSSGMGLGLMAGIIVLMVNNFFGDRWSYMEISAYLWVFAGLVGRLIIMEKDPGPSPEARQNEKAITTPFKQKQKKKLRYYDL